MALDVNPRQKCETTLYGISLVITRYEYVDMYHTLKDLWNAFMSLPKGVEKVDRAILFDSHPKGYLDSVWSDLFGATMHIHQVEEGTCLEQVILVPPGYSNVLNPLGRLFTGNCCRSMSDAFVDFVVKSCDLENIMKLDDSVLILGQVRHIDHPRSAPEVVEQGRATILDRVPFVSHSRSNSSHEERAIANLDVLEGKVKHMTNATTVQIVDLLQEPFLDQLRLIRQSHVLIGHSDSGISQMIFMQNGTHVFKLGDA